MGEKAAECELVQVLSSSESSASVGLNQTMYTPLMPGGKRCSSGSLAGTKTSEQELHLLVSAIVWPKIEDDSCINDVPWRWKMGISHAL